MAVDELVGRTLGEFVVRSRLGEGGFGAVYKAEQVLLGREAVIKVLQSRLRTNEIAVQRFLREARLASRIDHPYAAHVYAFGVERDGLLWIAMELVDGVPLSTLLQRRGRFSIEDAIPFLERLCEVVHTAHARGIVHRDIKPSNVMVLERAGRLLPKLLDLGIAKNAVAPAELDDTMMSRAPPPELPPAASAETIDIQASPPGRDNGPNLTQEGAVLGSPPYMAPEQWSNSADADERTDVYALGVLTYEILVGKRPFEATTVAAMFAQHIDEPVPSLGLGNSELDAVVARALAKRPADRYESTLELGAALRSAARLTSELETTPRLAAAVRDAWIANAPQPLAEAVAALDAARSTREARDALGDVASAVAHYLGMLALACRVGPDSHAAVELLRQLCRRRFVDDDWTALATVLVDGRDRATYPIPELIDHASVTEPLWSLLAALRRTKATAAMRDQLVATLAALEHYLQRAAFVMDYTLGVVREDRVELWTGVRRLRRASLPEPPPELAATTPVLIARSGTRLALAPMIEIAPPAPSAGDELFMLAGRGLRGARYVALPQEFERERDGVWSALRIDDALEISSEDSADDAPYPGLSAFTAGDAARFYGREREVEAFLNRLRTQALLAIVGASGAGKSSFVQAGVIPQLPASWQAITIRPGPTPGAALEAVLRKLELPIENVLATPERFGAALRARDTGGTLVIVVDQFEELFTLCRDPDHQNAFAAALVGAARAPDDPVRVILTLRDDFLLAAEQLSALRERLGWGLQLLATPGRNELMRILTEPARRAGYTFDDPALPVETVDAVVGKPGALALLAFTAAELWRARDRGARKLTRASYEQMGGVGGALSRHADSVVEAMPANARRLVREVFRHVVTSERTRAVVNRDELRRMLDDVHADGVLEKLIDARLLVASEGPNAEDRIELVHETLLVAWPRLADWLREDAEDARMREQIRVAARQWDERGRPDGLLWRDDVLVDYQRWRAAHTSPLAELDEAFAAHSIAVAARGRRARRTIIASMVAILSIAVVVLIYLRDVASDERRNAEELRQAAHVQLVDQLVEQGRRAIVAGNSIEAARVLARAYDEGVRGRDLGYLLAGAVAPLRAQRQKLDLGKSVRLAEYNATGTALVVVRDGDPLVGVIDIPSGRERRFDSGDAEIFGARFAPSGDRVVTAGRFPKLWTIADGQPLVLEHDGSAIYAPRFSADGQTLVAHDDAHVIAWDTATGKRRWRVDLPAAATIAIDPRGGLVAAGTQLGSVWLGQLATGARVRELTAHASSISSLEFSPDATRLVTASYDRNAKIWDLNSGAALVVLAHEDAVVGLAVSREYVLTASSDGIAKLWRLDGTYLQSLAGHRTSLTSIELAPTGTRSVSAGRDGRACLHQIPSGTLLECLDGHLGQIHSAHFSPDGRTVATASIDGTVRIWDATVQRFARSLGGEAPALVMFATSTSELVIAGIDGRVDAWQADGASRRWSARADGGIAAVRALPDGRALTAGDSAMLWARDGAATPIGKPDGAYTDAVLVGSTIALATDRGAIELRPLDRPQQARVLRLHSAPISQLAGSPDGTRLAAASYDAVVSVIDVASGQRLATLTGHTGSVTGVTFSGDGKQLATTSLDRTARVWSSDGHTLHVLSGGGGIASPHFDGSGTRLVTAHEDSTVRVWSTQTGRELAVLRGHDANVFAVAIGPGPLIASCGIDGTTIVWDLEQAGAIARLVAHTGRVLQCEFTPDGGIASAAIDGSVKLWKLPATGVSLDDELVLARTVQDSHR